MGILTTQDKEKLKRVVPKASNKIIDATVARLYIAYPDPTKWTYTELVGAITLVDDIVGNTFFLKLVDIIGNNGVLWDQELWVGFEYNQDRKFFHTFEIDDCLVGLLFEDTNDATHFYKRVTSRQKYGSKNTVNNKNAIALKKALPESDTKIGPRGEFINVNTGQRERRSKGVLYYDGLPPPEWRSLYAELEAAGISEDMIADNRQFIKDYIAKQGGPLVGLEPPIPRKFQTKLERSTTVTSSNSISKKSKKAPPPPPPAAVPPSSEPSPSPTPPPPPPVPEKDDTPSTPFTDSNSSSQENIATHPPEPTRQFRLPPANAVPPPAVNSHLPPPSSVQPMETSQHQTPPAPSVPPTSQTPPSAASAAAASAYSNQIHRVPPPLAGQTGAPSLPGRGVPPPPPARGPVPPPPPARGQVPPPPPRANQSGFNAPNGSVPPPPPPARRGGAPPPPPPRASRVSSGTNSVPPPPPQPSYPPPQTNQMPPPPTPPTPGSGIPSPPAQPSGNNIPPPPQRTVPPAPAATNNIPCPPPMANNAPPAPPPPPMANNTPPAPPPPPMGGNIPPPPPMGGNIPPPPPMGDGIPPPPAMDTTAPLPVVDSSRDALLASIRGAGGVKSLRKTDKSQLERPSVLLQEARGETPTSTQPNSAAPGGQPATLADALSAALSKRKGKVAQSDDEDDDDW